MLVDRKMLAGGIALLVSGMALVTILGGMTPAGYVGMTDDEIAQLRTAQQENKDYLNLSGILIAVGFLLVLISFGARRRGGTKKVEKKAKV
ncbi:MAG: hypothetical protein D9C04_03125 [Nitrosopumilus sp. B06]|nr:MAG: hypothetical protein D9C04_03125 [Nitrosopumilus sp. B06]